MTPFLPITNNVNQDRKYFTDARTFVKMDENFGRSQHEADMLTLLSDSWYTPKFQSAWTTPGYHCIRMEICPGETLENLKGKLTTEEKRLVVQQILRIVEDLLFRGVVHGDLNESNILYDRASHRVFLIDWETGRMEDSLQDVYGPPWGLLDLLGKLK